MSDKERKVIESLTEMWNQFLKLETTNLLF